MPTAFVTVQPYEVTRVDTVSLLHRLSQVPTSFSNTMSFETCNDICRILEDTFHMFDYNMLRALLEKLCSSLHSLLTEGIEIGSK